MSNLWTVKTGFVERRAAPKFTAKWCRGEDAMEEFSGSYWSSKGTNDSDTIHLYDIRWHEEKIPSRSMVAPLVREAAVKIDGWINRQM